MAHDSLTIADAIQIALEYLLSPMSSKSSVTPLEHYLIVEYDRRHSVGETFPLAELRRILITTIRHKLLKTNRKPYVGNLITRSLSILKTDDYQTTMTGSATRWARVGLDATHFALPSEDELRAAANRCSHIPMLPQTSEVRDSQIYTTQNLRKILNILFENVEFIDRDGLFDFFDILLTNWIPKALSLSDDSTSKDADLRNGATVPQDEIGMHDFAHSQAKHIWLALDENERRFFHASTWAGATPQSIADSVLFVDNRNPQNNRKYSRPSVLNILDSLQKKMDTALAELDSMERREVIATLKSIATYYRF